MEKIFDNPSKLEALVKQKYGIPDFMMMENAALAIKQLIYGNCLILCGKGNNGGDGYALARLLGKSCKVFLYKLAEPTAKEAQTQYQMCKKLGIKFVSHTHALDIMSAATKDTPLFIVDCLFGTGFKGELPANVQKLIDTANKAQATRIACDIPSGLAFDAHYTVTMGEHKLALFSDRAKQVSGQIIVTDLGIDRTVFESASRSAAFLVTADDMKLPYRTNKAAHKGTYGHTAVFAGEKSGAAIISATAAMNFGSGLTTIIKQEASNLEQFKISPELMLSDTIPPKTTCIVLGPGSSKLQPQTASAIQEWWFNEKTKAPAAVFDAGMFGDTEFVKLLKKLNTRKDSRIVLTPHLAELTRFCASESSKSPELSNITVEQLADCPELKIKLGKTLTKKFPKTTLVIKSANTFICSAGQTFIVTDGAPSLAKGGSGDVLSGMIAALLAQGYTAKDAAITGCEVHALAGTAHGAQAYDLSPMRIIEIINCIK